jgi:hypothetical protein
MTLLCCQTCSAFSVDLVLSHYKEPVEQVSTFVELAAKQVNLRHVYVYHHVDNNSTRRGIELEMLHTKGALSSVQWFIIEIPNWGREAYAYLRFLEQHKRLASLADFVWFSQSPALPESNTALLWKRLGRLSKNTGMLGLGHVLDPKTDKNLTGGCDQVGGPGWYRAIAPHIASLYFASQRSICKCCWTLFLNGEFIVSRTRLMRIPIWILTAARETLELPDEHPIHADKRWREIPRGSNLPVYGLSTRNSPLFGYAIERSWNLLFNCTRLSDGEDFQCLDAST